MEKLLIPDVPDGGQLLTQPPAKELEPVPSQMPEPPASDSPGTAEPSILAHALDRKVPREEGEDAATPGAPPGESELADGQKELELREGESERDPS